MLWLSQFGGKIVPLKRPEGWSRKPAYSWRLFATNDVQAFLVAVRPYLVLKGAKADEALREIQQRKALLPPATCIRGHSYPPERRLCRICKNTQARRRYSERSEVNHLVELVP